MSYAGRVLDGGGHVVGDADPDQLMVIVVDLEAVVAEHEPIEVVT